ncbi:aminodeoxychorismate lyase [Kroppenstedtia guangzhouensis]|uniref:Endolytic murein transglycosylase n=1 Tax=Kroppenstedtia guangzhouensis TaxID=1274356 RepID=A0ABQ1G6P6_9BACL|nr:endolytic transglycosylase MltG [Kroppenstedtia guangzhouensis]GGA37791.1 aminodeoxychorismate lyase [Kroppenstedtia guangzhouensis]
MKWLMRIIYTLVLFSAWSFLAYLYVDHSLGSPKRSRSVQMEIKSGTSTAEIGHMLKEQGLIRNDWFFSTYAWLTGKSKGLQAGVYEIPPDVNVNEILDIITKGRQNTVTVTIPEGYTLEQIGEKLEQKTQFSKEDFIRAAEEEEFEQDFLREVPTDAQRRYRLEGYLFPSTYNIPKTAKPKDVINMMLGQFHNKMEEHQVMEQLESKNLTLDKWVTIASIVEREGQAKQEFPKIAGVIYNRLNKNMRLQVDATIQYARGAQKARLSYDDLKLDSVYNTYKIDGLPPGAISNPGERALLAALKPDKHSYLYYVTKKDGTGEHYFAETFEQHRLYIKQSKKTQMQNSAN